MGEKLEAEFHEAMLDTYRQALEHGYPARYFLRMVNERGGVGAAKRLLKAPEKQYGLTRLWNLGLLSISAEALVLRERWQSLFTDGERQTARERLRSFEYEAT